MKPLAILLILILMLQVGISGLAGGRAEGNLRAVSLVPSVSEAPVNKKVTFWLTVDASGEFWDVKVGIYVDFHLVGYREIPYVNKSVKIWFDLSFNESGTHNVSAVVDYLNDYQESNEGDNAVYLDFHVSPKKLPDLVVEKIDLSEETVYAGDNLTVNVRVISFNESSYSVPMCIYVDEQPVTVREIPFLPSNMSYVLSLTLKMNEVGNHTIEALVNYGNAVNETNTTNDYLYTRVFVYPVNYTCDIWMLNVSASSVVVYSGDSVSVRGEIKNTGTLYLTNLQVAVYYDMHLVDVLSVPEIAPNSTEVLWYDITVVSMSNNQSHSITMFADYGNHYREYNESNNIGTVNLTVRHGGNELFVAMPDDIYLSTNSLKAGMKITIFSRIWNIGNVSGFVNGSMFVDNTTLGNFTVLVNPGHYALLEREWICIGGWHKIGVIFGNTTVYRTVWVDMPSAIVEFVNNSMHLSTSNAYENQTVWVSVLVKNTGTDVAAGLGVAFIDRFANTSESFYLANITVAPHSMKYISVPWRAQNAGNHTIVVAFLPELEIDILNLNLSSNVSVREARAELFIGPVNYSVENYTAHMSICVNNTGVVAAQNFIVEIVRNGHAVNRSMVSYLPSNSSLILNMNVSLLEGDNDIVIYVDRENNVEEYNESNNSKSILIVTPYRNAVFVMAVATILIGAAVVGVASLFVYALRAFIAGMFFSFLSFLLSLWYSVREKTPFREILGGYKDWENEKI